ncbi:MAG: alcohol dehydrogenase catalytic domain-containing protein [Anaerolineae bacterium]|nr:alcohol dehydrogenase catalytic domain-containing protein [Anaerolineae bacterium]MDQ7034415.1 alcohol dehydrogenase catalytic domain-containing protein [Anaerolineae bacterium]
MRALVFDGVLKVSQVAKPIIADGQALLKIRKAGICNTDMELVRGYKDFHGILGHEFVADVVEGDVFWQGKRVVGSISINCDVCDMCLQGVSSQCRNRTTMGINGHDGAFADFMMLTANNLYQVSDSISDAAAVFVEPLAACLQITEAVHISPRDNVVVIGAGKMGMLAAQVLKLTGANLSVVIRHEKQGRLLEKWGIRAVRKSDIAPKQAQIIVDCTGNASGFHDALDLVQPRGTIVLKSTYADLPQADLTRVVVDEIRVVGSRCGSFDAALRLLEANLVDVESLIEARYPFNSALEAFEFAQQRGVLKVLLEF